MSPQMVFDKQAALCKAMGAPIRLEILHCLRDGPRSVGEISDLLRQPYSTISHHISILRSAGILVANRRRQNVYCRVANPKLLSICDLMQAVLEEQSVHETELAQELQEETGTSGTNRRASQ